MKSRQDSLAPNGIPRYVHLYDNGGESLDRYTIVFTGNYRRKTGGEFWYLGCSTYPFHPQGFGQHGASQTQIDRLSYGHLGRKIKWADLPPDVQRCVWMTYADLWDITAPSAQKGAA